MSGISNKLFHGTSAQARQQIQKTIQTQGVCIVSFLYFAQAMKFRAYEEQSQDPSLKSLETNDKRQATNYKQALLNSDFVFIDGIAMQIFDRVGQFFFGGKRKRTENLNGTDFLPYILEHTKDKKVGIIMSTVYDTNPKINKGPQRMDKGLQKLKELYPHIDIIFTHQTEFSKRGENFPFEKLHTALHNTQGTYDHILFLNGIGGPAQEIWTEKYKKELSDDNLIILNNGATIDYYSGFETRAPKRVIRMRIGETLRRVCTQPKKNLKKLVAMLGIVQYWIYLAKKIAKKS